MNLSIGSGRRITIPKELFEQSGLKIGDVVSITFVGGKFVIDTTDISYSNSQQITSNTTSDINIVSNQPGMNEVDNKPIMKSTLNGGQIIIKSNIEDKDKYTKPILSDCGLVVRSKRRYIKQFCEVCKGKLVEGKVNCKCCYNESYFDSVTDNQINPITQAVKEQPNIEEFKIDTPDKEQVVVFNDSLKVEDLNTTNNHLNNKSVVGEIKKNKQTLEQKINNMIKFIPKKHKRDNVEIRPVKFGSSVRGCDKCGEYFSKGFMLDDEFYCKSCAIQDFKQYRKEKYGR